MIKSLVSIEVDLASSLAIRFACQLGNLIPMELHPVYVKGYASDEPTTGIGWARHSWEREMVREGKEEISEMITSEMDSCPAMIEPTVIYGDRGAELEKLMDQQAFDLYLEGAPYPFVPASIYKRLHLKFYQRLRTPMIWLRGIRKIGQVLLLCDDPSGTQGLVQAMQRIWANCLVPVHLAALTGEGAVVPTGEERPDVVKAKDVLSGAGCRVSIQANIPVVSGEISQDALKEYGLVGIALDRKSKKDSPTLQWLSQIKEPLMVVLY